MAGLFWFTEKLTKGMNVIAYTALTIIMLLTCSDVVLRFFKMPIVGTFEIVGMLGAIVLGFAIPYTSFLRAHIYVDFIIQKFPTRGKDAMNIITRVVSIVLFATIGYNLFLYGIDIQMSGEVSLTRQIPFHPIAYGLGISCFVQCLVLFTDIFKVIGGNYE